MRNVKRHIKIGREYHQITKMALNLLVFLILGITTIFLYKRFNSLIILHLYIMEDKFNGQDYGNEK